MTNVDAPIRDSQSATEGQISSEGQITPQAVRPRSHLFAETTVLSRLYLATVFLSVLGLFFIIFSWVFQPFPYQYFQNTRNSLEVNVMALNLDAVVGFGQRPDFNSRITEPYRPGRWLPIANRETGTTPLNFYRDLLNSPPQPAQQEAVIIVHGLGLGNNLSASAILALNPDVTFAFSPYSANLQDWFFDLRQDGREVLLELKLLPRTPQTHLGPLTIAVEHLQSPNLSRLYEALSIATGYVGVVLNDDSAVLENPQTQAVLLQQLRRRGLGIFDNRKVASALPEPPAQELETWHYTQPDFQINADAPVADINQTVAAFVQALQRPETTIPILSIGASQITVVALRELLARLDALDVQVITLSTFLLERT